MKIIDMKVHQKLMICTMRYLNTVRIMSMYYVVLKINQIKKLRNTSTTYLKEVRMETLDTENTRGTKGLLQVPINMTFTIAIDRLPKCAEKLNRLLSIPEPTKQNLETIQHVLTIYLAYTEYILHNFEEQLEKRNIRADLHKF